MNQAAHHIGHFNIARRRAAPGDPLVADFVDNAPRVKAWSERIPGFAGRWKDQQARVAGSTCEAATDDALLAIAIAVSDSPAAFERCAHKTVQGGFPGDRESGFAAGAGPNPVIWPVAESHSPALTDGLARLAVLVADEPPGQVFDQASAAARKARSWQ